MGNCASEPKVLKGGNADAVPPEPIKETVKAVAEANTPEEVKVEEKEDENKAAVGGDENVEKTKAEEEKEEVTASDLDKQQSLGSLLNEAGEEVKEDKEAATSAEETPSEPATVVSLEKEPTAAGTADVNPVVAKAAEDEKKTSQEDFAAAPAAEEEGKSGSAPEKAETN